MALVNKSQIKDIVEDMSISADFAEALEKKLQEIILQAAIRAKANKRNTIMPRDL